MSAKLERFYLGLPVTLQHAACSLVGQHTEWTRYGGSFKQMLTDVSDRTFWPADRIAELRDERLRAFIDHAARTSPFYQRRLAEAGLAPNAITSIDELVNLPVLTKQEIQAHGSEMISTAIPSRDRRVIHTSGSTGSGLHFAAVLRAVQEQWATWWRYRSWHGIERTTWCALFGGRSIVPTRQTRPPFWRYNIPGRQIVFSGYHMSPAALPAYVEELRKRRPPWLHGYPSLLSLLARFVLEEQIELGYPILWVTTGAENLLPQQASAIESAFGVRPRQHYGMAEAVANISECERGRLHVDEDFAAVEFVPMGGGQFRVVGTNFTNPATPLIRYDVLDLVTIDEEIGCDCGRPGRIVSSIDGRQEDYIVLNDGTRLGSTLNHIFKDMVRIREAQIRQHQPGEVTVAVVRDREYSDLDERKLIDEIGKRVGNRAGVSIDYVESLPRTRTGKLRFVVSEVGEGSPSA